VAYAVVGLAFAAAILLAARAFDTERTRCEYAPGALEPTCSEDVREWLLAGAVALAVLGVGVGVAIVRRR
jgi:hypothetical protein